MIQKSNHTKIYLLISLPIFTLIEYHHSYSERYLRNIHDAIFIVHPDGMDAGSGARVALKIPSPNNYMDL